MKDEVEKLRPQINILVNDAYALGRGQTDRLANDYVNPDKSIAERILALFQKAQVEAVRAAKIDELEHIERESVDKLIWWDMYLPENISIRDRLANLKEDGETK